MSLAQKAMNVRSGSKRSRRIGLSLVIAILAIVPTFLLVRRFDVSGRAAAAYDRHEYLSALTAATNHLRLFPNDRRAALMSARCLMRIGRADQAEIFYLKARPLLLADAHTRAYNLVNLNEPVQAAAAYEELLTSWPDDVLGLKRLAAVRMGLNQWREVLKLADRLVANEAETIAGLTMAMIAHHELKHYDQSVSAGLRVIERDSQLERMPLPKRLFWNNLALDLMALGRTDEARTFLERALDLSQDAGLMELLGLSYSQQGATDEAERCWRQAENLDPNNADVCLDLGRLALSRQRYGEAVEFLKRAVDRSTDAVEPLYNLSQAHKLLGHPAEAEHYLKLAQERRRTSPAAPSGMGADFDPAITRGGSTAASPESLQQ